MSGAYVAKPAADVPSVPPEWPDPPPGWDENWPPPGTPGLDPDPFFPAPFPPGYTPDYSMVITATAEITPSGTASVTGSLRDHGTYATNEPDAIVWTAAIAGVAVDLKFTGGSFASSISSGVSFGSYWGAAPSIEFDLTDDNDGDTVVLTGASAVSGEAITQTAGISVAVPVPPTDIYLVATMNWSAPVGTQVVTLEIESGARNALVRHTTAGGGAYYSTENLSPVDTVAIGEVQPMSISLGTTGNPMQRSEYLLSLKNNVDSEYSVTLTGNCKIYDQDGELYETFDIIVVLSPNQALTWLTIDTSPYNVTEDLVP